MSQEAERDRDRLERHLEHELATRGLTRRELVRGGAGLAGALGLGWLAAACSGNGGAAAGTTAAAVPKFTGTLRVMGLSVDLIDPIKAAGERALGFKLAFELADSVTMVQRAKAKPGSFDVFAGYTYQMNQVWSAGHLIPQDVSKITRWRQITPLVTRGKIDPSSTTCTYGDGDAPFRSLYVDVDKKGTWPSSPDTPKELRGVLVSWVDEESGDTVGDEPSYTIGPPNNFNLDSIGYNADVIARQPDGVDWPELLNESHRGRVALINDPGIGLQDAGAAVRAMGAMQIGDLGNMTRPEIDGLVKILLDYKRKGQFRAFWTTLNDSVQLMASGDVVLQSMWSNAVALLVANNRNVRFAAPPSGFRGWCSAQGISTEAAKHPSTLQACYDYLNWWHSGEPGAIMMRQGYYNAVQETSRAFVEPEEWDYWIEGKPAAKDLPGITGTVGDVKKGQRRDGGSLAQRACRFSSWNSYSDEQDYQVQRWNDLLNA
jgi:putative spermidine/putrescine transport system substrate-binding protein